MRVGWNWNWNWNWESSEGVMCGVCERDKIVPALIDLSTYNNNNNHNNMTTLTVYFFLLK